jgi:hypothetical protein
LASPAASLQAPFAQHQAFLVATSGAAPSPTSHRAVRPVKAAAVAPGGGSSKEAGMADAAPQGGSPNVPQSGSTLGSVSLTASEMEDAVQDAIVWANQHGLVSVWVVAIADQVYLEGDGGGQVLESLCGPARTGALRWPQQP